MKHIPEHIITEAVEVIITTRDLCGPECERVFEFAHEAGFGAEREKIWRIAKFRANAEWNAWKKAAGVHPKHRMW